MNHFAVHLKLIQHCKAATIKNNFFFLNTMTSREKENTGEKKKLYILLPLMTLFSYFLNRALHFHFTWGPHIT